MMLKGCFKDGKWDLDSSARMFRGCFEGVWECFEGAVRIDDSNCSNCRCKLPTMQITYASIIIWLETFNYGAMIII